MKKTDENFKKYLNGLKARGYDHLTPLKNEPIDDPNLVMHILVIEGEKLLAEEAKNHLNNKIIKSPISESNSTNPYARARLQVLKDLGKERRERIEKMESSNNIKNNFYDDFVKMVRVLGDRFSDLKK